MDNMGVVVDDLPAAKAFFVALGLEVEGETTVEGAWVDGIVGLEDVVCDIVMVRTPDGHGKLELMGFRSPKAVGTEQAGPANTRGFRRIMFAVDDIDETLDRLRPHGAEPMGEVTPYAEGLRMVFLRGPEGIIVALSETRD
jgi:catechol 2,3-dioxygenase-like lactoylglutathione lyase family enzyme